MKLSTIAWEKTSHIYNAIINHPFNVELMQGTLDKKKFAYYVEQDVLYLQDFSKCHAILSAKVPQEYANIFLKYAEYTLIAEQELVHKYFKEIFQLKETRLITPATISYTSYMLKTCLNESLEVGLASLLPCFWIYREVGLHIKKFSNKNNPYYRWIKTYASKDFYQAAEKAIEIFDILANQASEKIRKKMLDVFYKTSCLEWHFWNDCYNLVIFDGFAEQAAI